MTAKRPAPFELSCPLPDDGADTIRLAHGGGGRLMQQLLRELVLPALTGQALTRQHDAAVIETDGRRLAFTTDSYVVRPRVFPGGDIGRLAVYGTVNDLAAAGARPLWLSAGLIIEEGLPRGELAALLRSMREAADIAGVRIVTGDTKVVDRGAGDGLYINTAGIGLVEPGIDIHPAHVQDGDAVLVSGDVGRHGIAIMACREGLEFEPPIESDCAPLGGLVQVLLGAGLRPHCLRDITRGGLAAVLHEIAEASALAIEVDEAAIPVSEAVASACEVLGLDPLQVACEGRMLMVLPPDQAARTLEVLRVHPLGAGASLIGRVERRARAEVILRSRVGSRRILDLPGGELLPRIC
ncbi:MAG: hydrogenase expression/formation protein HypE [Nevskia sp.]|nr:hydrogenase expression/formation protein HypE [Nevskia sp.]